MSLTLDTDGAALHRGAALSILSGLRAIADAQPANRAGIRLHGVAALRPYLSANGMVGAIAAVHLGPNACPVRAILFDKTPETNWALGWHQDRTIVVRERVETDGFGPWTVKAGMIHVEPPATLMAEMLTMRIHLDDVAGSNAPLIIAPGSHRLGRIPETQVDATVARCGTSLCLAEAGDVWIYATPILHASVAASSAGHRRVFQIDFAASSLPNGLAWLGI